MTRPKPYARLSPARSASLSLLWPGLAHAYLGSRSLAVAFAVPAALIAGVILLVAGIGGGPTLIAASLFDPTVSLPILFLILVSAIWRLAAISDAFGRAGSQAARSRPIARVALGLAVAAVVFVHGIGAYYTYAFYDAGKGIFVADPGQVPGESQAPGPSPSDVADLETPAPDQHVNVLLVGLDSGYGRTHTLTDTMMVVSIDPIAKTVAMLSMPRDIAQAPLYSGGVFSGKLNSLLAIARQEPARFPDGPMGTLAKEIGYLIGAPIHYTASMNLEGFERMINLVGGVDITVERAINDPVYDWFNGTYGFSISAGPKHLDGRTALAFVRSRYGAGDNDFTRSGRQQQLLVALKAELTDPSNLPKLPQLLEAASNMISTNFPVEQFRDFVALAQEIPDDSIQRFVLGPPYAFHPPTETTGGEYILKLDLEKMAELSIQLFGEHSRYSAGQ